MPKKRENQRELGAKLENPPKEPISKQESRIKTKHPSKPFLEWKFQFNDSTGKYDFQTLELSDGSKLDLESIEDAFKRATGSSDLLVGEKILNNIAFGMTSEANHVRLNEVSSLLPALNPKNETEALLLGQFLALQDSGMKCLRDANSQSMFYHVEKFFNLATKLFNTANQTMHALIKYRTGGQQTVQVIHMHNEGQAILTQNLSHERNEGFREKNVE